MDVMKLKSTFVALGALAAASGPAGAENFAWGVGLKDVAVPAAVTPPADNIRWGAGLKDIAVPAPIPVPGAFPVREGFSYYLRADLGWAWNAKQASFSENGNQFGTGPAPFTAAAPFASGSAPFGALTTSTDDVFIGTIGVGAYFLPRFRGDLTLDFRGTQGFDASTTYAYPSAAPSVPGAIINGTLRETFKVRGAVAMANGYFDILPRGAFSPYIGAGIGFVYNDIERTHYNRELEVTAAGVPTATAPRQFNAKSTENSVGLAAALMAGVSFAFDHRWAIDVGYRAQYLDEVTVKLTPSGELSTATFGDHWEHQVRVGLRWNLW